MFISDSSTSCENFGDNPYQLNTATAIEAARDEAAQLSPVFGRKLLGKAWANLGARATLFIEKYDLGVPIGLAGVALGSWALYETGIAESVASILDTPLQHIVDLDILPLQDVDPLRDVDQQTYPHLVDQQPLPTDMPLRPITPEQFQ